MFITASSDTGITNTTSWKVVLPFYGYAAVAFLVATILLLLSVNDIAKHYIHPHALAVTHIMALGWGTMIILGASHQLVPVLIEEKLYSNQLATASFILAASGIPLLAYGFYVSDMGWPAKWGGRFVILAIIAYLLNLGGSMAKSKRKNVHAVFIFTAAVWLLVTASVGLMLVYNFTYPLLPQSSLAYLSLHAHLGIVGWFLLLVTGVGSRLIPMFLISKYNNTRRLWWIYGLINIGLLSFIFIYLFVNERALLMFPLLAVATAIALFGNFCYKSYRQRIRNKVDEQILVSLLSVLMMLLPIIFLLVIIGLLTLSPEENTRLVISYGFIIFFGWITAIILGMTFKTLFFIVWNKVYHYLAGKGKTPNPKDLFSATVFKWMGAAYISGFILFTTGVLLQLSVFLQLSVVLLLITSFLYTWNVLKLLMHKPRI
ncbi:MAG: cytochrome C oxidase subunit I [Saprospirales bacterium]|nr:cytochrome C oxidase subunit I [Saprospirales bacterium]